MKQHKYFNIFMKKISFAVITLAALGAFAEVPFKIGIAGYSFYKKSLDESLSIMRKIDCRYLCHKDFFLRYDASDAEIAAYKEKIAGFSVETLATGPVYAKDEATVRAQFEFAKKLGIKTCWDTGHAHTAGLAQSHEIELLGNTLALVHLHDNDGINDSHRLPKSGTIDWDDVFDALDEIGYDGYYNLEVANRRFGDKLMVDTAEFSIKVLKNMLSERYGN